MLREASNPLPQSPIVCECRQISEEALMDAITSGEGFSLEALCKSTGAGQECGSCRPKLRELLGDNPWYEAVFEGQLVVDEVGNRPVAEVRLQFKNAASFPSVEAGQHVSVRAEVAGKHVVRSYTVLPPIKGLDALRLGLRLQPDGGLTPWIFEHLSSQKTIQVSAPFGSAYWAERYANVAAPDFKPTVCMVAGTGVTLALALVGGASVEQPMHVHYRARNGRDFAFCDELRAHGARLCEFSLDTVDDESSGIITDAEVAEYARRFPGAQYIVCGPPAYMDLVNQSLKHAGVPSDSIQVEKFFLSHRTSQAPVTGDQVAGDTRVSSARGGKRPTWIESFTASLYEFGVRRYSIGAAMACLALLMFVPSLEGRLPHYLHAPGHEKIACKDCHEPEQGSLRQQLQTKVGRALGTRETALDFQYKKIENRTCEACHARPDDRHPAHRFYEPRFAKVRDDIGPQRCLSCHREHEGQRVTRADAGFCVACHRELKIEKDPATPTHEMLIKQGNWSSCLQCHDYHDNHNAKTPKVLANALPVEQVRAYLASAPSPYGDVKHKSKEKKGP